MNSKCADLDAIKAFIFDLDGVITRTAEVHFAAWKRLFDLFLAEKAERLGTEFAPFERADYNRHVDGKPRYDGVRSFLAARGIELPYGSPDDPPGTETVCALGNRKNTFFNRALEELGVEVYASTVALLRRLRDRGVKLAVISSSKNCVTILDRAGLLEMFDAKVDGIDSEDLHIPGKPAPDIFLEAAKRLRVSPEECAVVEDALAGVKAGAAGRFACIIGVDRADQAQQLAAAGADHVVRDLAELEAGSRNGLPSALDHLDEIVARRGGRDLAVFLDYDGVLTPIVPRPEDAIISEEMRQTVQRLARRCTVAIVSGRDLADVRRMAGVAGIAYAGSHGFDIESPDGRFELAQGTEHLPDLYRAEEQLRPLLAEIPGARLERKKFAIAIHFRQAATELEPAVREAVEKVLRETGGLRLTGGKKIFELRPDIEWDKGKAVSFLLEKLELPPTAALPVYLGDDLTDEDAFRELRGKGIGIYVGKQDRPTAAAYVLQRPDEVLEFLGQMADRLTPPEFPARDAGARNRGFTAPKT